MSKSVRRVEAAIADLGLDAVVKRMPNSTRTAQEAADACGCSVGQIVKSMIFEGEASGELKLILVSGKHNVDLSKAAYLFGETLLRADAKRVRSDTGFAIGGVAPIGHLSPTETWFDESLLLYDKVWAAAGAPDAVFCIAPQRLLDATGAYVFTA